jgi:hypothetical protein
VTSSSFIRNVLEHLEKPCTAVDRMTIQIKSKTHTRERYPRIHTRRITAFSETFLSCFSFLDGQEAGINHLLGKLYLDNNRELQQDFGCKVHDMTVLYGDGTIGNCSILLHPWCFTQHFSSSSGNLTCFAPYSLTRKNSTSIPSVMTLERRTRTKWLQFLNLKNSNAMIYGIAFSPFDV